jgi:hypothetical protein
MNALKSFFLPSKPNLRKQDILAFRTITTLLSFFEPPSNSKVTRHTKGQHDELRVLDALSMLLARHYEVAAVTTMGFKGTDIQVVVSVEPKASPDDPFHLIDSVNPRSNAPKKGYPVDPLLSDQDVSLVDPDAMVPEVLSINQEGDLLKIFLETQW